MRSLARSVPAGAQCHENRDLTARLRITSERAQAREREREVFWSRSTRRRIYSGLGTICEVRATHSLRATAQEETRREGKGAKSRFTSPFQRRLESKCSQGGHAE